MAWSFYWPSNCAFILWPDSCWQQHLKLLPYQYTHTWNPFFSWALWAMKKKPEWYRCYKFNVHGTVHRKNILIYMQQVATLHSLFYLETALHVSGGTSTHHQERKKLYLQHLVFVTPLLLPAAIVEELEPVWVCCGWRTPPTAHSNRFPDKINCVKLHLDGYILE